MMLLEEKHKKGEYWGKEWGLLFPVFIREALKVKEKNKKQKNKTEQRWGRARASHTRTRGEPLRLFLGG